MFEKIKAIAEFILFTVLVKVIIAHWLADRFIKIFKYFFVRSQRESIIYYHYLEKTLKRGHKKSIIKCKDGKCDYI